MAIKKKPVKKAAKKAAKTKKKPVKKSAKKAAKTKKKPVKKSAKKAAKTTLLARIAEHRKELEKAKNKATKQGYKFLMQAVKSVFKKFPQLNSFSWKEYTPYWDDGSECKFSVYLETLAVNEEKNPESLWELQSLHELLSDKDKEKPRIEKELLAESKDHWKIQKLKSQLRDIAERDPVDVAEKYNIKKTITDLLEGIPTQTYQDVFGEGTVIVRRDGISVEECSHD